MQQAKYNPRDFYSSWCNQFYPSIVSFAASLHTLCISLSITKPAIFKQGVQYCCFQAALMRINFVHPKMQFFMQWIKQTVAVKILNFCLFVALLFRGLTCWFVKLSILYNL